MDFGKESVEHEFERNARTAEAEQSKRAASRVKPTEPDRAGKQDVYKRQDIGCLSCYNMCSVYIASSLKCYHFRTCEGGKPPFNPPF